MEERVNEIKDLVGKISPIINESNLKNMNFALFYQNGRLGFMDLDAFAEKTKLKIEEGDEEQTLKDYKEKIDKKK